MWNNLIQSVKNKFSKPILTPVGGLNDLTDRGNMYYAKQQQAIQDAAKVNPGPVTLNKKLEYPQWLANAKEPSVPLPREVKAPQPTLPKMPIGKKITTVPYQPQITIPATHGGTTQVPPHIAQSLLNNFNDIGEATNAAKVLHHPQEQTYMPSEIKRFGTPSVNYGENASFKPVADSIQSDKSIDRGLMRVNSNTFNGLMKRHPDWMRQAGVSDFSQMNDPELNARVARLILLDSNYDSGQIKKNPSWKRWFAAPLALRSR